MATDDQTSQNNEQQSDYAQHASSMSLLSQQMYPDETPPEESGGEDEGEQSRGQEGEEPEGDQGEEAGEEEQDEGEEEGEESGEEGEIDPETGERVEVEPLEEDQVLAQEVTTKVNGKEQKVPVKDMVASYQTLEAAKEELETAKSVTKEKREEWQNRVQWADEQYNTAAGLIQEAEKLLTEDFDNIDWKTLREQDPAEWSVKKAEYDERKQKLADMKQRASEQYQQATQDQQKKMQEERSQLVQQEHEKLIQRLPEWKDQDKAQAGKAKLVKYLQDEGFSPEDLNFVQDHRIVLMAEKARKFDEINSKSKPKKKRVRKPTKTVKPGTSQPQDRGKGQADDPVSILYG